MSCAHLVENNHLYLSLLLVTKANMRFFCQMFKNQNVGHGRFAATLLYQDVKLRKQDVVQQPTHTKETNKCL